jgi:hypothetical protein
MRIGNDEISLDGTNMAVNITSDPIYLGHIANYNLQIVFTGTPGGNFKLQISNDLGRPEAALEEDRDFQITNWTDMADSAQTISAAGNHSYEVQNAGHRWVRLVWTQTSSTGTITSARFNVKGV